MIVEKVGTKTKSRPCKPDEYCQEAQDAKANNEFYVEPFPYLKSRMQPIDYEEIIKIGEPWNDPTFPHGPQALFINGEKHQGHEKWKYVAGQ